MFEGRDLREIKDSMRPGDYDQGILIDGNMAVVITCYKSKAGKFYYKEEEHLLEDFCN